MYPIAKKLVIGATKITDNPYSASSRFTNEEGDVYPWTLTTDDYVMGFDRSGNLIGTNLCDFERFLFICY